MMNEKDIRPAGGVEKLFLVLNQIATKTFAMAAEINGDMEEIELGKFAAAIQKRHRQLRASLKIDEQRVFWFRYDNWKPTKVTKEINMDPDGWKKIIESELCKPFNLSDGPLFRIFFIPGSGKTKIILISHHSIGDGFSMVNIFNDLLGFLSGEDLSDYQKAESMDQTLNLEDRVNTTGDPKDPNSYLMFGLNSDERKVYVETLKLDRESTEAIIKASRARKITINGLLNAAMAMAIVKAGYSRVNRVISLRTPASVRPLLGSEKEYGLNIITRLSELKIEDSSDLWELGRKVNEDLANIGSADETRNYVSQFRHLLFQPMDFNWFVNVISSTPGIDLMVSNLGRIEFDHHKKGRTITQLWGPFVIAGDGSEQTVGALSLNGELHLTHTSMEPIDGLLETAYGIIMENLN